jgi:hypothetical protein
VAFWPPMRKVLEIRIVADHDGRQKSAGHAPNPSITADDVGGRFAQGCPSLGLAPPCTVRFGAPHLGGTTAGCKPALPPKLAP